MSEIILPDGTESLDPKLDRMIEFDERSRNFSIAAVLTAPTVTKKLWTCGTYLDQGNEGACVGFSCAHELAAAPQAISKITNQFARESIYWEAQKIDPWEGGAYPGATEFYEGTSVLSGIKILRRMGYITSYRWAFNVDDLANGVLQEGPAVIGIEWTTGMFVPDAKGYVKPVGSVAGGHAILVRGYDSVKQVFRLRNSWGREWGINADCLISKADMADLLKRQGEVCFPIGRKTKSFIQG